MDEESLRWIEWGELGEPAEPMLKIALNLIDGVAVEQSVSRAKHIDVGGGECPNTLQNNALRGTIAAPSDNFYTE